MLFRKYKYLYATLHIQPTLSTHLYLLYQPLREAWSSRSVFIVSTSGTSSTNVVVCGFQNYKK